MVRLDELTEEERAELARQVKKDEYERWLVSHRARRAPIEEEASQAGERIREILSACPACGNELDYPDTEAVREAWESDGETFWSFRCDQCGRRTFVEYEASEHYVFRPTEEGAKALPTWKGLDYDGGADGAGSGS